MLAQDGDLLLRAKKTSVIIVHRGLFFQASSSLASAHDFPIPPETAQLQSWVVDDTGDTLALPLSVQKLYVETGSTRLGRLCKHISIMLL
jgi:hypothetical protein